mgnify:CR=1 FL=1
MKYVLTYTINHQNCEPTVETINTFDTFEEARQWCIDNARTMNNFDPWTYLVHTFYSNFFNAKENEIIGNIFGGYLNTYYSIKRIEN